MNRRTRFAGWSVIAAAMLIAVTSSAWAQSASETVPRPAHRAGPLAIPAAPTGFAILGSGSVGGGRFFNNAGTADAWLGNSGVGIQAWGLTAGAIFTSATNSGTANIGYGDVGVMANGSNSGGIFTCSTASGTAYVGDGDYGVYATGNNMGGYFSGNHSGVAKLGVGDYGIMAWGNAMAGYFIGSSSSWAYVGSGSAKITGNGSLNFVQNHPTDPGVVIVYAAPEGDEVATYTRGTARLVNGEAHIVLGETFKWVTNPDVGLTAHLTPHGAPVPLAIESLSTEELVVRGPAGAPDGLVFDYLVYGLRIGFEQTTVVQEKKQEAYIPSMKEHRDLLARRPDLVKYTALARYTAERKTLQSDEPLSLKRANALRNAVHEFDPSIDKLETPRQPQETVSAPLLLKPRNAEQVATPSLVSTQQQASTARPTAGNVSAEVAPVVSDELATRMTVSGVVEPGDVLVVDRERPEFFARGERSADPTVVGVVVPDAGVRPAQSGVAVAVSGIARCKVDATFGPIAPGDLLVTAPTPGRAMRASSPLPGTVVGKALEPLVQGQGTIRILVTLR